MPFSPSPDKEELEDVSPSNLVLKENKVTFGLTAAKTTPTSKNP